MYYGSSTPIVLLFDYDVFYGGKIKVIEPFSDLFLVINYGSGTSVVLGQKIALYDQWEILPVAVIRITAPAVCIQKLHCSCDISHFFLSPLWIGEVERIEMYIMGEIKDMGLSMDMFYLEGTLE